MKRIHLFEFEDLSWFPDWIRRCMTRLINVMHKLLKSDEELAHLLNEVMKETHEHRIVDLCSGAGGPMPDVVRLLEEKYGLETIQLTLTDLYPNHSAAAALQDDNISYLSQPVDATRVDDSLPGLRTMVGSFHHMKPELAKKILASAQEARQPICIFEISDNSFPFFLWWTAIPINFITCLFITPLVRPMTWQQLVFTYLIPVIPLCFAWDGAVSNARTYTMKDMDVLLENFQSENYVWKKGTVNGKAKKLFLIGRPV